MVVQKRYQITYLEETLQKSTSNLSAQSRGRVDAAIAFLRHCNEFRKQIWSLEEFKTLWQALFISYAPELRKRGDPCIGRRRRLCDVDGPVLLAFRVSSKASVGGLSRPKKQQRIISMETVHLPDTLVLRQQSEDAYEVVGVKLQFHMRRKVQQITIVYRCSQHFRACKKPALDFFF